MLQRHKRKLLIEEIRTRTAPLGHMTLLESMELLKDALVKAEDAIVCITFTAKWCGPWRMIKPDVLRLAHVYKEVKFYEIDMDDNEEIAVARSVTVAPTFQFYKMGNMVAEFSEPNKLKLTETLRRVRRINITPEPYDF
ncbi:hypothetical protein ACHWQZ_G008061 [Mnemiopsis leidyi]